MRAKLITSTPNSYRLGFEVEDTGCGIPKEDLSSLFDAFSQSKAGRNTQEGTGLGLAINKSFVQLMGGDITIDSQLDVGTIVTFDTVAQIPTISYNQEQPNKQQALWSR